jgi:predicted nucleic acid-binding protein
MYLLDTNVVSELRRQRPHGAVLAWIDDVPGQVFFLSAVTIGQIQSGIELTRRQDRRRATELEAWLDQVASAYNVLPMDAMAFRAWARLKYGKPDALVEDAMIAATAQVHNLIVATRNVRDLKAFRVPVFNPFSFRKL